MKKFVNGFTLSETLIVIAVLGIIATLTIPALVNKNKESVAKTKVRKAMAAYESALNKMIIENDLKSDTALNEWAGAVANCDNQSNYFKKVQGDGCTFKTSDGIWWNISDIERPIIAFKEDDLTSAKANAENDYSAFVLVGRFGADGSLRVDDLAYETTGNNADQNSDTQVKKLYSFLGLYKGSSSGGGEVEEQWEECQIACEIDSNTYRNSCKSCKNINTNANFYVNDVPVTGTEETYYDSQGLEFMTKKYYENKLREEYNAGATIENGPFYDFQLNGNYSITKMYIFYRADGSIESIHGYIIKDGEYKGDIGTVWLDENGNPTNVEIEG